MIDVKDLRVGCLANVRVNMDGSVWHEEYITPFHISEIESGELVCEGVKLTEDILIRFGCEKNGSYAVNQKTGFESHTWKVPYSFIDGHYGYIEEHDEGRYGIYFTYGCGESNEDIFVGKSFHFAHEFQNRIYAFTGQELILQPLQKQTAHE